MPVTLFPMSWLTALLLPCWKKSSDWFCGLRSSYWQKEVAFWGFHHPVLMCILKYRMRNEWWKCQILNKKPLICKKVFTLAWGGFWLVRKRVNVNNGRWKCILRINSSKHFKKIMWLSAMRQTNLTSSGLISFHSMWNVVMVVLKCLSKVCHQSISV